MTIKSRKRRRHLKLRQKVLTLLRLMRERLSFEQFDELVNFFIDLYPQHAQRIEGYVRRSVAVDQTMVKKLYDWAKASSDYVNDKLESFDLADVRDYFRISADSVGKPVTYRPLAGDLRTEEVECLEKWTGLKMTDGYFEHYVNGGFYRSSVMFMLENFQGLNKKMSIIMYSPDHCGLVLKGYDLAAGCTTVLDSWREEVRGVYERVSSKLRSRLSTHFIGHLGILARANPIRDACAVLVPWANYDIERELIRSIAVRSTFLFLPDRCYFEQGEVFMGLLVDVTAGSYLFVDRLSHEVCFSFPIAFLQAVVGARYYEGKHFDRVSRLGDLALFKSVNHAVKGEWFKISDGFVEFYCRGLDYARLYDTMLDLDILEADDSYVAALSCARSFSFPYSEQQLVLLTRLVYSRLIDNLTISMIQVRMNHRPGLTNVLYRYLNLLIRAGTSLKIVLDFFSDFVNSVELILLISLPSILKYLSRLFRTWFPSFKHDIDSDDTAFIELGEESDTPLVFVISTEVEPYRCHLNKDAAALMEKFELVAGADRHMRDYTEQLLIRCFAANSAKSEVKGVDSVNNMIYNVVTQIDPDYQLSYPLYHLYLRNSVLNVSLNADALYLKIGTKLSDWIYRPILVHVSKAGHGEMIRRMNVDSSVDALISRNLGVVHQGEMMDWHLYVEENFESYADAVFTPDWRRKVAFFKANPVAIDSRSMMVMSRTMTASKYSKYMEAKLETLESSDTSELLVILKQRVKEQAVNKKMGVAQTVFFLEPEDALAWLILCKEITARIDSLWAPNIISGDMKSDQEICDRIEAFVPPGTWGNRKVHMADQSQFDKSEMAGATAIETVHWRYIGVPEKLITKWFGMNYRVRTRFMSLAIKLVLSEMRRSGHPTTLNGNGLVTTYSEVTSKRLKREDIMFLWFQGDDVCSLLSPNAKPSPNASNIKAAIFNLIEKDEVFQYAWYNCSRFILEIGGRLKIVYDPMKMLAKLIRPLTTGEFSNLSERYQSYKLLAEPYSDFRVVSALVPAMAEMYALKPHVTHQLLNACAAALSSEQTFTSIWSRDAVSI